MERRTLMKAGLALGALPLLGRHAFADDKKPITFWYEAASPDNQQHLKDLLIDPFNAAHPDSELSIDFRGEDLDKQLRIAMLSGSGPDIVYTAGPSYVASMAQAGQLLDLGDYAQKLGWNDRILPLFMDLGKYNGKLYAATKNTNVQLLWYDDRITPTPPKTWEEMIAKSKELVDSAE